MNERTIWILRIAAIFIFLLLAYLLMDLYAKLRRMEGDRPPARTELRIPHEPRRSASLPQEPRSGDIV